MYPRVSWTQFMNGFQWAQAEHLLCVAPTGGGKTTLLSRVLKRRQYVIVFVTKGRDPVLEVEYEKKGYKRIGAWRDIRQVRKGEENRYLLWPQPGRTVDETLNIQRRVFAHAFDMAFQDYGWTIVLDEEHYICKMLGLATPVELFMHQARSGSLTMVNGTQRPAWVPVVTYPCSDHAFLWSTTRASDLKALGELGGVDHKELAANLSQLEKHEFVYVNTRRRNTRPVISEVKL